MSNDFNHHDMFVNFDDEKEIFYNILMCNTKLRILTIKSDSGRGKSTLIGNYKRTCKTKSQPIPVSLINLKDINSVNKLIEQIVKDLEKLSIFPKLQEAMVYRDSGDYDSLYKIYKSLKIPINKGTPSDARSQDTYHITMNFEGANFEGAIEPKFTGLEIHIPSEVKTKDVDNSEKVEELYHKICDACFTIEFEKYLKGKGKKTPTVILFDAYENASSEIKNWLMEKLFPILLQRKKSTYKLIVVVAGENIPQFKNDFADNLCDEYIQNIDLKGLKREAIIKLAELNEVNTNHLANDLLNNMENIPLSSIMQIFTALKLVRGI